MKVREITVVILLLGAGGAAGLAGVEGLLALAGVEPTWRHYAPAWATDDLAARFVPRPGIYLEELAVDQFNSLGLRGPEIERADVLFLGDSCTYGVGVAQRLTFPGLIAESGLSAANAGVPGYNTTSALARLETSPLMTLKPRAVVIYFGWNDHRRAAATERTFARLRPWAEKWRVAALMLRFQQSLGSDRKVWNHLRLVRQVPLGDFKANLEKMTALCRAAGAKVFVVTAASDPGHLQKGLTITRDWDVHGLYVEAARAAARESGAALVDFAADVEALPTGERKALFLDPVHLSEAGHRRLAGLLRPALDAAGINAVESNR